MRKYLLASTLLTLAYAAHAQSLQTGTIDGMPYYLLPASGGCSAATPCSVITYLGVQSESAGAIASDVNTYFGGSVGAHTIVIAPQENGDQDGTNNWGGYNTATTPEQAQMVAVVQGVEAQMGNTVNPAASVVTGGSLGGTGTQAALIAYGPKGQVQPGVFSAGVSFDAADWSAASDPSQVAALCGVPLTAVHGVDDTNQNISFDQNLASAINSNSTCGNSFNLVPVAGAGHGTWGGPSGYQAGTGPGTPLSIIASDLNSAPTTVDNTAGTVQTGFTGTVRSAQVGNGTVSNGKVSQGVVSQGSGGVLSGTPSTTQTLSATLAPGKGSVTDCNGTVWTVSASGNVMKGSTIVPGGGDTSALQLVGCVVYGQDNDDDPSRANAGGWFTLNTGGWTVSAAPAAAATQPATTSATKAAATPAIPAPAVCGNGVPSGAFHVAGGQIVGPNGKPWIARGIDVHDYDLASAASAITSAYPGTNMIRVASYMTMGPSDFADIVSQLTSKGIVVEFSDYTNTTGQDWGGGQGEIFTGATLANESAWYASMAKYYANNTYVWFGTDNEPAEGAGLSAWHQATYNAIRSAGNNNPILIDPAGWDPASMQINADQSIYGQMTNIIWDPHIYSNSGNPTTDLNADMTWAKGTVTQTQSIQSADGIVPAIVGEFGVGGGPDPIDMVQTVINMAVGGVSSGLAAWAWDTSPPNVLSDSGSQYSQMVALYINTSVQACSTAEATANANATLASVTAQLAETPAAVAPAANPQAAATPATTDTAADPAADAAITQANAIVAAAQAQMANTPSAAP